MMMIILYFKNGLFHQLSVITLTSNMSVVCHFCGKGFQNNSSLKIHLKYHEHDPVHCDDCGKNIKNEVTLKIHSYQCGTVKCEVCSQELSKKNLERHMQTKHKASEEVKCSKCPFTARRADNLKKHIDTVHKDKDLLHCSDCDFTTSTSKMLSNHNRKHKVNYRCNVCGKQFTRSEYLKSHQMKCEKKKEESSCEHCGKTFSKTANMKRHMQSAHKTIKSDLGIFKLDGDLTTKKNSNPSTCDICGKDFKYLNKLKRHMPTHNAKSNSRTNTNKVKPMSDLKKSQKSVVINDTAHRINQSILSTMDDGSPGFRCKVYSRVKKAHSEFQEKNTVEVTEDDIFSWSEDLNLSDIKVKRQMSLLRKKGVKLPRNIRHKLKAKKTFAKDLMKKEDIKIVNKKGKEVLRDLVHTTDIQAYTERLAEKRNIDLSDPSTNVIIEKDDGKKAFKLIVNITSKRNTKQVRKDSGAYKSHIVACIYTCPETYENLKIILEKINYSQLKIEHKIICDLKLSNIFCGISSNSSKHPCFLGECYKLPDGSWAKGKHRTIASLNSDNCDWITETNSSKDKLKNYNNSEYIPLVNTHMQSQVVKDLVLIPTLHTVVLGPVNKLMKEVGKYVCLDDIDRQFNIHRDEYHGMTYQGRACRKLMKKSDILAEILKKENIDLTDFTDTMRELEHVDKLCNRELLDPNYRTIISKFEQAWLKIHKNFGVSIPNKGLSIKTLLQIWPF